MQTHLHAVVEVIKHLSGRHDQHAHASKRGGVSGFFEGVSKAKKIDKFISSAPIGTVKKVYPRIYKALEDQHKREPNRHVTALGVAELSKLENEDEIRQEVSFAASHLVGQARDDIADYVDKESL